MTDFGISARINALHTLNFTSEKRLGLSWPHWNGCGY